MGIFDEKGEQAIKKAFERQDVQEAMRNMTELIIPYISMIISAAVEEMNNLNPGDETDSA